MDRTTESRDPTLMGTEKPRGSTPGPLRHLSDLDDYDVVDGEPDIRGWDVRSADGLRVGEVKDLVVDCGSLAVRYMEVELDGDRLAIESGRRALLPLGTARLNDDEDVVVLRATAAEIGGVHPYVRDPGKELDEGDLHARYGQGHQHGYTDMGDFFGTRRFGRGDDSYLRRR